ncbi:MAG: 6-bladed beta-propeller [Balneola sp.]
MIKNDFSSQFKRITLLCLAYIFLAVSCNKSDQIKNSKFEQFVNNLPTKKFSLTQINNEEADISSVNRIVVSPDKKILIADFSTWSIHLLDENGELLDSKGGEGRGPYEFLGINSFKLYKSTNIVQVYDGKLSRVTFFEILDDSLKPLEISTFQAHQKGYNLADLYKFNKNFYGLFELNTNIFNVSTEQNLRLFSLDENFNIADSLMSYAGDEEIEMDLAGKTFMVENPLGFNTRWGFQDSTFIISNSENLDFTFYNLNNNTKKVNSFSAVPALENLNQDAISFYRKHYPEMISFNSNFEKNLLERKQLPYFINFGVNEDDIIVLLSNYDNVAKELLILSRKEKDIYKIEIPSDFFMHGVIGKVIYGVRKDRKSDIDFITIIEYGD